MLTIGRSRGACPAHAPPPHGTQFFCFRIHFHQKVPTSEVHAPPNGCTPPPTGNPGSATAYAEILKRLVSMLSFIQTIEAQWLLNHCFLNGRLDPTLLFLKLKEITVRCTRNFIIDAKL